MNHASSDVMGRKQVIEPSTQFPRPDDYGTYDISGPIVEARENVGKIREFSNPSAIYPGQRNLDILD